MKHPSFIQRILIAAIYGIGLALGLTFPAKSLSPDEVEKVTILMVSLAPELGPFAWDEEEADRLFDEDSSWNGEIAAAGFSRDNWRHALDATFKGYLATIPNDVFSRRLTEALDGFDNASHLSDAQKQELRGLIEEKIAEIQLLRAEGARYADLVRPHVAKLESAFDLALGADR